MASLWKLQNSVPIKIIIISNFTTLQDGGGVPEAMQGFIHFSYGHREHRIVIGGVRHSAGSLYTDPRIHTADILECSERTTGQDLPQTPTCPSCLPALQHHPPAPPRAPTATAASDVAPHAASTQPPTAAMATSKVPLTVIAVSTSTSP